MTSQNTVMSREGNDLFQRAIINLCTECRRIDYDLLPVDEFLTSNLASEDLSSAAVLADEFGLYFSLKDLARKLVSRSTLKETRDSAIGRPHGRCAAVIHSNIERLMNIEGVLLSYAGRRTIFLSWQSVYLELNIPWGTKDNYPYGRF